MPASSAILMNCRRDCIGANANSLIWLASWASKVHATIWHKVRKMGYLQAWHFITTHAGEAVQGQSVTEHSSGGDCRLTGSRSMRVGTC